MLENFLNNTAGIYRLSGGTTKANGEVTGQTETLLASVPCNFRQLSGGEIYSYEKRGISVTHNLLVKTTDIQPDDRVVVDSVKYRVVDVDKNSVQTPITFDSFYNVRVVRYA